MMSRCNYLVLQRCPCVGRRGGVGKGLWEGGWGLSEEGRGGVGQVVLARRGER